MLHNKKNKHYMKPAVTQIKMWRSQTSCVTVNVFTVINFDRENKKNALLRYRQMGLVSTYELHPVQACQKVLL